MRVPTSIVRCLRALASVALWFFLGTMPALAWPWSVEPQPLLHGRDPIRADAGSPLAWDQSWRILWFLSDGKLEHAYWTGKTFNTRRVVSFAPQAEAGLAVDSGWHFLYCLDADGRPHCVRRIGGTWTTEKIWDGPLTRLLGVDAATHALIGYDAEAQGLRLIGCNVKTKTWRTALITTGLGTAGDTAAIDQTWRIIYSTHETVASNVPRHAAAGSVGDPTDFGLLKPWPLVATAWDGTRWTSRVIDETGLPQQPAVRATDHRVFYTRRDDQKALRYFQPARKVQETDAFGALDGWSGQDTWVDHDQYEIRLPYYPDSWSSAGVSTQVSPDYDWRSIQLTGPITIVPYYAPVWSEIAVPPRLTHFRALVNPKQGRLVQHRERAEGEVAREQTGMQLVGYLYRGADGALARSGYSRDFRAPVANPEIPPIYYPQLGAAFDPANPPVNFAALADPAVPFFCYPSETTVDRPLPTGSLWLIQMRSEIPTYFSTNGSAPFVPPHLRLPTLINSRTFGHRYTVSTLDQPGSRHRSYRDGGTDFAAASGIAVDVATGVTFYTQPPPPSSEELTFNPRPVHTTPPLASFLPVPDPKLPVPASRKVWIVMVY